LHGAATRRAVAPYELPDRYRSDPAWFLNHGWASQRKYPKRPHAK
jgi:hypothetical protein